MIHLQKFLEDLGYQVKNEKYNYKQSIGEISDYLFKRINLINECQRECMKTHIVAHSLGGLVVRILLNRYRIRNLGRVIQIGPPNSGSNIADFLKSNYLFQKLCGYAGQ